MNITVEELKNLTKKILSGYGYSSSEVEIVSDVILYAQLRGNNQGVVKLLGDSLKKDSEASDITIVRETKLSALLNGNKNIGMVVMNEATKRAITKAAEHGFGIVGTQNTASSTGAIGYYVRKIAEAGFMGFAFSGSPETVPMHGSYEPMFGTNPLAIGIPSNDKPIVFDMATSAMAYFGLIQAKTAGQKIPADVAMDSEGNQTTDPSKAMDGAILPFDRGYKGASLSMMVEVFTGQLVGSTFAGIGNGDWGNLVYAIDPELLVDKSIFTKQVSELIAQVKSSKKSPGIDQIYVPGERGDQIMQKCLQKNSIEIEDNLYKGLSTRASTL